MVTEESRFSINCLSYVALRASLLHLLLAQMLLEDSTPPLFVKEQIKQKENQPQIHFEEVESLGNQDRGGFGSTGIQ